LVLKDPYLVDCCGVSFCQSCIKPVQEDGKPCPVCNVNFITCIPDKRLRSTLNEMIVYCSNNGLGCEWTGELGSPSLHLNTETKISDQEVSSMFASLGCAFCGKVFCEKILEIINQISALNDRIAVIIAMVMSPLVKMSPLTTGPSALRHVLITVGCILNDSFTQTKSAL
jgi:hypothetical protein